MLMACLCGGCSIVTYNRVFPKFTWYWSHDARMQRLDRQMVREWHKESATNSPTR